MLNYFSMHIIKLLLLFYLSSLVSIALSKQDVVSTEKKENTKEEKIELEPAPLPTYDMGSHWSGVRVADGVSTYKLKENSKVIGTFHLQKQDKKIDWEELESKDFFTKFVQRKQEWLRVINIREWIVDQHSLNKRKNFIELNVAGSYRRPDGKQVFFQETQLYLSDQIYQILVISPNMEAFQTKSVRDFFKKALEIGQNITASYSTNKSTEKKRG